MDRDIEKDIFEYAHTCTSVYVYMYDLYVHVYVFMKAMFNDCKIHTDTSRGTRRSQGH